MLNRLFTGSQRIENVVDRERSGRPVSVVASKMKNISKGRIRRNSERSIKKMTSELQCSEKSVSNNIKDTEMKSVDL